jgi:hypothetical protein
LKFFALASSLQVLQSLVLGIFLSVLTHYSQRENKTTVVAIRHRLR